MLHLCIPDATHHYSESKAKFKLQNPLRVSVTVAESAYWQLLSPALRFRGVAILAGDI